MISWNSCCSGFHRKSDVNRKRGEYTLLRFISIPPCYIRVVLLVIVRVNQCIIYESTFWNMISWCTHTHTNQLSPTAIFNYNMPSLQSKKCNITQPQQCGVRQVFPWIRISCLYVLCYAFQLPIVQAAFQAIFPIERWVYAFRWTPSLWWVSNKRFFSCPYIIYTACLRVFGTARGIRRRERRRERVGRGTSHPLRNRTDPSY